MVQAESALQDLMESQELQDSVVVTEVRVHLADREIKERGEILEHKVLEDCLETLVQLEHPVKGVLQVLAGQMVKPVQQVIPVSLEEMVQMVNKELPEPPVPQDILV